MESKAGGGYRHSVPRQHTDQTSLMQDRRLPQRRRRHRRYSSPTSLGGDFAAGATRAERPGESANDCPEQRAAQCLPLGIVRSEKFLSKIHDDRQTPWAQ